MKPFVLTFLLFLPLIASSQKTTVSGNVLDELTGTHNEIGVKTNDISNFGLRARYAFNF
jgi:hypothetical protein